MDPLLIFLRKNCKEIIVTMDNNLVTSLTKILDCFFSNYQDTEMKKVTQEEIDYLESILEPLFIFSLVWSICCTSDSVGRSKLDVFLRELTEKNNINLKIPNEGTIYDYSFNIAKKEYEDWSELIKKIEIDPKMPYNEIMIPTKDSTRNLFLMKILIKNNKHILTPGPTGTGKSLNAMTLLTEYLGDNYQYISIAFSAQTSANQTQDTIDGKLDKRRKGYYGPPFGKKCVIFVDDLNMPKKEIYGAQPSIEILRQFLDYKVNFKK